MRARSARSWAWRGICLVATLAAPLVHASAPLLRHEGQSLNTQAISDLSHRRLNTEAINQAVSQANEIGASVRDTIKKLRGGNDEFYTDLINTLSILVCDGLTKDTTSVQAPQIRFVEASDARAYKDSDGKCIKVKVNEFTDKSVVGEYNQGRCEVKPNCYWGPILPEDTERRPVYSVEEAMPPPDGAMTYKDAEEFAKKWLMGFGGFVVPGIILAVLSLLTMLFFIICRCCCNRCGGRSARDGGYSCTEKFLPVFFFLLFSIGVVVCAAVSLLYQRTVTNAVSDMFDHTKGMLTNTGDWIVRVRTPLQGIADKVVDSADEIRVELNGTDFIEDGLNGLTTRLTQFGSYSADRTLPDGCTITQNDPYCIPCEICTTINTEVTGATSQMEANAGQGIEQLRSVRSNLNGKLVDIAGSVRGQVDDQVKMSDTFILTINDTHGQVDDIQGNFDQFKPLIEVGVLGLFALALVSIAFGLIGVLFGLTPLKFIANIIHIAYMIGFIGLIITFLLSAVFLALSVLLGDGCEVTLLLTKDWTPALGTDNAKAFNACFRNESLIKVFKLESSLEFARGGIEFPDNIQINEMLDFSQLDTFANAIQSTDTSTFKVNTTLMDDSLALLNSYTKQTNGVCNPDDTYTLENILEPWSANNEQSSLSPKEYIQQRYDDYDDKCIASDPKEFVCEDKQPCLFSKFIGEVYHRVSSLRLVQRDSVTFVDDLKVNMTKVTNFTDDFKAKTVRLDNAIKDIRTDLETSLIKYVNEFEGAMYCTFLAKDFDKVFTSLCGDLMPALTMISILVFLSAVFLIPVTICLIIAVKRLKARGSGGHVMDNEMKFK